MVFQGDDKIAEHARLLCMYVWHENEDSLTSHDDDAMMMMPRRCHDHDATVMMV